MAERYNPRGLQENEQVILVFSPNGAARSTLYHGRMGSAEDQLQADVFFGRVPNSRDIALYAIHDQAATKILGGFEVKMPHARKVITSKHSSYERLNARLNSEGL